MKNEEDIFAYLEPLVGFALTSSVLVEGSLGPSPLSSVRAFLRLSIVLSLAREDAGRFPFMLCGTGYAISIGGVPIVSEPFDDGEERLRGIATC